MPTPHGKVKFNFYRPQRSWGKVMFLQASVILSTGVGLPQCMLGYHTPPRSRHRPGADTPLGAHTLQSRHPPRSRHSPWEETPPWSTPPPKQTPPPEQTPPPPGADTTWEQTPPGAEHAGRYGQHAGGTHPTGMQSCFMIFIHFKGIFQVKTFF